MQTYCALSDGVCASASQALDQMVLFNIHDGAFDEITIKMENKAQAYKMYVHERASGGSGERSTYRKRQISLIVMHFRCNLQKAD